jgi:hypothetical protein
LRGNRIPDKKISNTLAHEIDRLSEGYIEKKTQHDLNNHYPHNIEIHFGREEDPKVISKAMRNVMAAANINEKLDPASNAKRWTSEQIEKMHESPLLKDPESEKQSLEEKEEEEKEKKPRLAVR